MGLFDGVEQAGFLIYTSIRRAEYGFCNAFKQRKAHQEHGKAAHPRETKPVCNLWLQEALQHPALPPLLAPIPTNPHPKTFAIQPQLPKFALQ